ncbi:peroxiredoxin [Geitlerinema sp. PCC 9228]|jgi:peroxiredoxin Q/BCP|uniref:peroxiredoxin n=1 Tax=Geitlerinema sp. PCC 9228 TaxID=111611 RepID=UPI0008F9A55E|nr:peroxiredoxin [Geitlerinema sp. PCC 9228]
MTVQVGDRAPDFTLPSQTGESISLNQFVGKQPVVLYFYPKDETPGCTKEACAFRDRYQVFQEMGAQVIGVSNDSTQDHQKFAANHNLPFILLSDRKNEVRKLYGVPNTLWILPGRVTYVIDKEGTVRHIFDRMMQFDAHVEESLKVLRSLQSV